MKGKTILVVDDDRDILGTLSDLLGSAGFRVWICDNARRAMGEARTIQPDLIILDLRMPGLTGMELIPRLQLAAPRSRIMILSAYADSETSQKAIAQDVAAVLWKPFNTETLIRTIHRILGAPEPQAR
jgi:CheY-like chemotaxis protein